MMSDIHKIMNLRKILENKVKENFSHQDIIKHLLIVKAKMKIFIRKKEKYENKD